jgi:glycosyltransferase involved in cell wall biosynthesis
VILYACREAAQLWPELPAGWKLRVLPVRGGNRVRRVLFEQLFLPFYLRNDGVTVSFHPSYTAPWAPGIDKRMVSILDAQLAHVPADFGRMERLAWKIFVPTAARRADAVIAVSRAAARDVAAAYRVDSSRIHGIPLGVDPFFCPGDASAPDSGEPNPVELQPYILAVGDTYPHKNFDNLVRALGSEAGRRYPEMKLVIVGRARRGEAAVEAARSEAGIGSRLIRLQGVSEAGLRSLYRGCRLFVMPSLYEGFCLPLAEALACGAPVICHDHPVLREVGGEAACYLDAREPEALAASIAFLWADNDMRRRMSELGPRRAALFSWAATVSEHVRVLRSLEGDRGIRGTR